MPDWATWCWQARTQCRMTQEEAANVAGVAERTWRRWEGYEGEPPAWRKEAVRDAMAMELVTIAGAVGRR